MNLIFVLILLSSLSATAQPLWPGKGGKICLDTPKPAKASVQDYKMATDNNAKSEEDLKKLENRPTMYSGPLTVEINDGSPISLPGDKGIYVSDLDTTKKHVLKIKDKNNKVLEVIRFSFDKPSDPRIRISQGSFYHKNMRVNPPPRKCPWII